MPATLALRNSFSGSLQQVISSYGNSHGKDSLHIITINACKECPPVLKGLMDLGIPWTNLGAMLSLYRSLQTDELPGQDETAAVDEYSEAELDAIIKV